MRVVSLLVLALVACGGPSRVPDAPKSGGRGAWREVASEHFVVWTNTSAERARSLVQTMEHLRQVVLGVSFFKTDAPGKSFVIAFDDLDEVHEYIPAQFIAHAWSAQNVILQPIIVLAASSLEHDRRIVTHELTHVIAFNVIRHQPDWFSEGIAGYFETARLDEERATIDVGEPLQSRLAVLVRQGATPTAALFACDRPACKDDRFYATTWALVTYLHEEHANELWRYIARLIQTPPEQQAQIFAETFPTLTPAVLDRELATWIRHGRIQVMHYKVALRDWSIAERSIGDADSLAAKGVLRFLITPDAGTPREVTQSLALDNTNLLARMIEAAATQHVDLETAHAVTAAHPDDWRAWWLAWRAATGTTEKRAARDKTCALLAATPTALGIDACARAADDDAANDARRDIFSAAMKRASHCLATVKVAEIAPTKTVDLDIDDAGAVTSAHVMLATPAVNACIEQELLKTQFPPHHAGPVHLTSH